jgi:glycosyltransferase involved in cell wall biosynthesis
MVARRADGVIVVSPAFKKLLPERGCQVIPSGLDLELFRPASRSEARQELGLDPDAHLVFFGGDPTVARKRVGLAESAVEMLRGSFPDVQMIKPHNIPHEQMPLYMNACDALVLTSLHEGSPNVVKEALACNLPVVSVDVGDVRQRIGKIDGCVVCANDEAPTIAGGLAAVLKSGRRIHGRETVADLDEVQLTQRVIEVYHSALARAGKPAGQSRQTVLTPRSRF